jgi:hypothetical protein
MKTKVLQGMPTSLQHLNKDRGLNVFSSIDACVCFVCLDHSVKANRKSIIYIGQEQPTPLPFCIQSKPSLSPPKNKPLLLHHIDSSTQGKTRHKHYGGGLKNPIQILTLEQARTGNWRPQAQLSYERSSHPLDVACTSQHLELLAQYCSRTPTARFVQHVTKSEMHVTTSDLRDLLSHSKPIADETITLYLELLTTQYNIAFLTTNTIPKLKSEGWSTVQRHFATF